MEFRKILVPVNGSKADEAVMGLACELAKKSKGKIWAVYVITVKRSIPLEADIDLEIQKGEELLDRIETIVEEQDYEVETNLLQAREAGPTIIDEAVERGADVIVMGAIRKRRFGQFSLGNVVPYVLKNAPCNVILYHQQLT